MINLEAGLAYIAFLNYSMKAIANEVYCDHAKSYLAVAVVSRQACKDNERISLLDFKGKKSCHGGYSTAAGWNYPITHIKTLLAYEKLNDREIAGSFFSEVCAPSELEVSGVCNGCGDENGFCPSKSLYFGESGAFRCLVEEMGDIAFLKADTALLYSMEGPHNQSWSNKSIRDFMWVALAYFLNIISFNSLIKATFVSLMQVSLSSRRLQRNQRLSRSLFVSFSSLILCY